MASSLWLVASGPLPMAGAFGLWPSPYGIRPVASGRWPVASRLGLQPVEYCSMRMAFGRGLELWLAACGPRPIQ